MSVFSRWKALRFSVMSAGRARVRAGLEAVQLAAAALVAIRGSGSSSPQALTSSSSVRVPSRASLAASFAALTFASAAQVPVRGSSSVALGGVQLTSSTSGGVTVTMPPANWDLSQNTARTMGRTGGHLALHYWLLGTTHYVWYRQGSAQPDPAIASPAELAGRTGIRVDLPASAQTAAQVATATASAIDAVSGFGATAVGDDVQVTGASTASAGGTAFSARGREGIIGTPDNRSMTLNSFAAPSLRACLLDTSDWGGVPVVLTGFALGIGNTHSSGVVVSVWQGGSADDEFNTATPLGVLGTTSGDGTVSQTVYVQSDGVYVDPSLGRVWLAIMHASGGAELSFTWYSQASATGNNYVTTGNNAIHLMTSGPSSSDPEDLPASLGTVASSELGMLACQVSFVEASNFQCNMAPTFDFGTLHAVEVGQRDTTAILPDSSDDELVVGNSYNIPSDMRGLELYRTGVCYATHVNGSDYCAHLGVGGAAVDDWSGATVYEVGQTSGTATGWVYVQAPAGIPLTEGTRVWLLLEFDGSGSALAFDQNEGNIFEDDHFGPAVFYNGRTTESEFAPLTNPIVSEGEQTTNLDYDPSSTGLQAANSAPGPWVVMPDGFNFTNDNNVGTHGTATTTGFAVAS